MNSDPGANPIPTVEYHTTRRLASARFRIARSQCCGDPPTASEMVQAVFGKSPRAIVRKCCFPVDFIACELEADDSEKLTMRAFFLVTFTEKISLIGESPSAVESSVNEVIRGNDGKFLLEPDSSLPYFEAAFVVPASSS